MDPTDNQSATEQDAALELLRTVAEGGPGAAELAGRLAELVLSRRDVELARRVLEERPRGIALALTLAELLLERPFDALAVHPTQ
ncbi:MAG: hypothetical protein IT372_13480 [Polyangiaceae bacterium]|nr:hypothetical protein [Polyangiaceae bacterium]